MKLWVRKSLLIGVVLSLIFLSGCGTLEKLVNKEGTATSLGDFIGGVPTLPDSQTVTTSADSVEIILYFADSTGKYLVKEQRRVPKTESLARETVTQWLKGPESGTAAQASVPTTTVLRDIAIRDNVVIVDLSKEFLQPSSKVTPEVALYGLVNTLTQFSTIKQAQFRIEGEPMTNYGTIDTRNLVAKESLIKGGAGTTNSNPIVPTSGADTSGLGVTPSGNTNNGALTKSPSSINLFSYPPAST